MGVRKGGWEAPNSRSQIPNKFQISKGEKFQGAARGSAGLLEICSLASGIYLDGGLFQPHVYWAGIGWAVTVGSTPFVLGDDFSGTITNNYAGTTQTFLARAHGFQLPST